ncbi:MAG: recombinase family protein [Clostridia bacterium]|nr:recombinase family protein [Clostridia bacterium]
MVERYKIAAYTRISVDEERNGTNTSIENQKAIIGEYCKLHFPTSTVDYFEDRDKSGYSFEKRPCYHGELRPKLVNGEYDILIVKDLSRFSRRLSKGMSEFEDFMELGLRIISIGDSLDTNSMKKGDLMKTKMFFMFNEMPVTDASEKVSAVIASRQQRGEWICSVPYGYVMKNTKKMIYEVDEPAAEVVREIFRLYINGWGYKKIAEHLTAQKIPTARMREKARKEAMGDEYHALVKDVWSIQTVGEILKNDFYIGTLRSRKYQRKTINGPMVPVHESEQIVFENFHTPIVDYRTFTTVQEQLKLRAKAHYRGIKKNENNYSGFLVCGDCGAPMFARNRDNLSRSYICGNYHRRGLKSGCTTHKVDVDFLDEVLKEYIRKVRDNSASMIKILEEVIKNEPKHVDSGKNAIAALMEEIDEEREVLRSLVKQRAKAAAKSGENSVTVEAYDIEIEKSENHIEGLHNQLELASDTTNTMIRVNRVTKTVIDVFNDILEKDHLDKNDINLIISHMVVFEDHIEVKLRAEVDELLRTGTIANISDTESEVPVNFDQDAENIEKTENFYEIEVVQRANKQHDKVFRVNVVSVVDPLEIYTDREGEVIFKKYSPIGELSGFASQYAETLYKTCNLSVIISDRDAVIASAGVSKKEYSDKNLSEEAEKIIESRGFYSWREGTDKLPVIADSSNHFIRCAMPIISEGDVIGCVASVADSDGDKRESTFGVDAEAKLIQTAAGFLGRHTEA